MRRSNVDVLNHKLFPSLFTPPPTVCSLKTYCIVDPPFLYFFI